MRESKAQAEARVELAKRRDNVTWRNNTGKATHYKGGKTCPMCKKQTLGAKSFTVPYGLSIGSTDLVSCVPVDLSIAVKRTWGPPSSWGTPEIRKVTLGAFVGIEMKSAKGRVKEDQDTFRNLVKRFGGHVDTARSAEEAVAIIESVKRLEPWI